MKKVILSAAALMFGAVAFAQTTTSGTEASVPTGVAPTEAVDNRTATTPEGNYGESIQNGNDHKVRVRQAGSDNSVYTNQSDGSTSGGNKADVVQTGAVQQPNNPYSGQSNMAATVQVGGANEASTWQQGDRNMAAIDQGLSDDSSTGNKASIQQGNANNAEDNQAAIAQDGTSNEANIFQTYDNNEAHIDQDGSDNKSSVRQIANPENSAGHYAYNIQAGEENSSTIEQSGSADNDAIAIQKGDRNQSYQVQSNAGVAGEGNQALVDQGEFFTSGGSVYTSNAFLMNTEVDEFLNDVNTGESFGATAYQSQTGLSNEAEIYQFGRADESDSNNQAGQVQEGDDNDALIVQNLGGNDQGGDNYAFQIQTENSSGNLAALAQNGTGHKGFQWQDGTNSSVRSVMRGSMNKLSTYQQGDANDIETAQRGQHNAVLITQQSDGNSYVATQNLPNGMPVGMPNGGNQIDVWQTGPGMDSFSDPANPFNCDFTNEVLTKMPLAPNAPANPDICQDCN